MFYNLHSEAIIGYKKLSDADLGIRKTSNQTHIGLYADTLNFITNYSQESSAQLIYNDKIYETTSMLDPIRNPNGSFRSPKIRIGEINNNAVARKIRNITMTSNEEWYLLWFGLENEELVFLLIEKNSNDYKSITNLIGNLNRGRILQTNSKVNYILQYLNTRINHLNFSYFEELELFAQTNERNIIKKINPKRYDIEKAQKIFQKIGREGEEIVNQHLERLSYEKKIKSFNWVNKKSESGLPFDFKIILNNTNIIYSDAKSTSYRFEQKMIFSSQELRFIYHNPNYMIHRVFALNEEPKLKVCENISIITPNFIDNLNHFKNTLEREDMYLHNMKISVPPTNTTLNFYNEVI